MTDARAPLVSVVVPVYNVEAYIDDCLDSVRAQTYGALEIVLVEDGSTDGTVARLDRHLADGRVRLIRHDQNGGLSKARNTGIEAARGDYVLFVDSDDMIHPRLVEACVEAALTHDADVVAFDCRPFQDGESVELAPPLADTAQPIPTGRFLDLPQFAWLTLIRADLLADPTLRFPEGYYYEDGPFHWALGLAADRVVKLDAPYYHYRQRGTSITGSTGAQLLDQFHALGLSAEALARHDEVPGAAERLAALAHRTVWSVVTRIDDALLAEALRDTRRYLRSASGLLRAHRPDAKTRLLVRLLGLPLALPAVRALRKGVEAASPARRAHAEARQQRRASAPATAPASDDGPERILHVIGQMDRAGAETMLMNVYRALDRERFQFDFVSFSPGRGDYDDEIEALGGRMFRIPGTNPLLRLRRLRRLLSGGPWRVVHAHTLFSSGLHLLAARLAGVPVRIAHSHSTADANSATASGRAYQRLSHALLDRMPTQYVACGAAAAAYLFPGRSDVVIVPNAIDCEAFVGATATAADRSRRLRVLQVGRLQPVKNHRLSLDIAAALRDAGTDVDLRFAGDGELRAEIEEAIAARDLRAHVSVLGLRDDIAALMADADVLLMPSLHEGFPVVLVESQAAGLPAVLSDAIAPEVDLGLGLIDVVALDAPAAHWAARVVRAAAAPVPAPDARRAVLAERGFSATACARQLASLYATS